jgi:hypothetical protein
MDNLTARLIVAQRIIHDIVDDNSDDVWARHVPDLSEDDADDIADIIAAITPSIPTADYEAAYKHLADQATEPEPEDDEEDCFQ